ncbi:hypothetical protein MAH1_00370 [Sessilibacter sp. MAH1]
MSQLRRLLAAHSSAHVAVLLVFLLWTQFANAHHLASHSYQPFAEQGLCDCAHSPAGAIHTLTTLNSCSETAEQTNVKYSNPILSARINHRFSIRAPPSTQR